MQQQCLSIPITGVPRLTTWPIGLLCVLRLGGERIPVKT